jgi:hypothetical protein
MNKQTRKVPRTGRKALESLIKELVECRTRRAAKAFDRYLMARHMDLVEGDYPSRPKVCWTLDALGEELKRRKTMTGEELLKYWVWVNKGNRAKRFLEASEKAEEAAERAKEFGKSSGDAEV